MVQPSGALVNSNVFISTSMSTTERLSEEQVADAFHSYLKSSLAQAKAERLLDTELLSSAEADIMIAGAYWFSFEHTTIDNCCNRSSIMLVLCCSPIYDDAALRSFTTDVQISATARSITRKLPSSIHLLPTDLVAQRRPDPASDPGAPARPRSHYLWTRAHRAAYQPLPQPYLSRAPRSRDRNQPAAHLPGQVCSGSPGCD